MSAMNADERRERLRSRTAEAASDAGSDSGRDLGRDPSDGRVRPDEPDRGPRPGALFVLPETADHPVEWALLEPAGDAWLAVPADTNPLVGPGDVWLPAGRPPGPLCLRCRFGTLLSRSLVVHGRSTGSLPEDVRRRALETRRLHERGELEPGPLAVETADDPEYRDWERDVLEPAVAALRSARSEAVAGEDRPFGRLRPARMVAPLAAALAALALGLGGWVWQLHREVDRLSQPVVIGATHEVSVGAEARGPVTLRVRADAERLLVFVVLSPEQTGHERYRLELVEPGAAGGAMIWSGPAVALGPVPELNLIAPRKLLDRPEGVRLRVLGIDGNRSHPLADVPIRLEEVAREDGSPGDGEE